MKIGLLFGSFNPVHTGHLLVATLIREAAGLDEVWFVVSPQNPFKININLADERQRLEMVKLALIDAANLKVSEIEFNLPKPSYTHITLNELTKAFPACKFHIIIGEDNAAQFNEWKEGGWIQDHFDTIIYNRRESHSKFKIQNSKYYNLPLLDISATEIRKRVKENKPIKYFVPENVEQFILFHKLYR